MRVIIHLLSLFGLIILSCKNEKVIHKFDSTFQKNLNALFKDASTSPLNAKDLKQFSTLDFFPLDSNFVVRAKIERTPNSNFFDMKTNTKRVSKERVYGILIFNLKGNEYRLNIYQNKSAMENQSNELFLPFLDDTNGMSSYGGGRYLDLQIPTSDSLWLDFNRAYNPHCAYNERYSCPIVPRDNYIPIRVTAGVKRYIKP